MDKETLTHLVEFEISRRDILLGNLRIGPIKYSYAISIIILLITVGEFVSNYEDYFEVTISILFVIFFIYIILFLLIEFLQFIILPFRKWFLRNYLVAENIVKNIPYKEVLKQSNMIPSKDKEIFFRNAIIPLILLLFVFQLIFAILMLTAYHIPDIGLVNPKVILINIDIAYPWIVSTVIVDFFILSLSRNPLIVDFFYSTARPDMTPTKLGEQLRKKIGDKGLVGVVSLSMVILYFWVWKTIQFILINLEYFKTILFGETFLFSITLILTIVSLILFRSYMNTTHKFNMISIEQERYREIRRQLYEIENPDIEELWEEFKLNAPW